MNEDKMYYDIQAEEIINLRDVKGVWIATDRKGTDERSAAFTLQLGYYGNTLGTYLHYDTSKLLHSAFEHYRNLLSCTELDVSQKPVTL
jgi:hypothetical protein